ncbi:MAG: carbamoyltransferase HypF [bacterium]
MDALLARVAIRVTGVVQGVGYRPFAYAKATDLGLTGFVGNDAAGVFAEAQGEPQALACFVAALREGPPLARVDDVACEDIAVSAGEGDDAFRIVESAQSSGRTTIPPDTAACADCLAEVRDPADRRYRYPFTACTHCGPRYTLVTGLPYDRPFTTMAAFPLCPRCQREYDDPRDRRFHAQPTACPECGPRLAFRRVGETGAESCDDEALADALSVLESGGIVAVKGVGGYHLACDARSAAAVDRLRARKQRGAKPFAVMARDSGTARLLIALDGPGESLLASHEAPIVLADALDEEMRAAVAPGQGRIGVMLPYTPLHHLMFSPHPAREGGWLPDALVMTSGNLADEPICIDPVEAEDRLSGIADAFLHHDRPIHVSCDDSVVAEDGQPVRRSRGYAPLPLRLPVDAPPLLAVGGELKTTLCVASGAQAWMSQHIGDTANLETLALLDRTSTTLGDLVRVTPEVVAADMHPGYLSRRWAEERARDSGAELVLVQHHHAHVASLMAEHGVPADEPVIGFAFDGTGYGLDGTIWGGEILLTTYARAERLGHLRAVPLPGGDAAIRHPSRTALAHLHAAGITWDDDLPPLAASDPTERRVIARMLMTGTGCTPTTSMGRLFDALASLWGVRHAVDYEGQAAIEWEALAARAGASPGPALGAVAIDASSWDASSGDASSGIVLDPGPLLRGSVAALREGLPAAQAARAFHEAVADAVAEAAALARERTGAGLVGLTGGVFANRLLEALCRGRLGGLGMTVLTHRAVPPHDGGLALGQAAVAAAAA